MGRLIDANRLLKGKTDHDMISTHLIYNAPTVDAILIPGNATNGDVIKALWNVSEDDIDIGFSTVYLYTNTRVFNGQDRERIFFNKDWWNAPYQEPTKDPLTQAISDSLVGFAKRIISDCEKEQANED